MFCEAYRDIEKKGTYFWEILDRAIYGVCVEYPNHQSENEIFSKVALINRTYRTNLHFAGKDAEKKVAEAFVNVLDARLTPLIHMTSLTTETLPILVGVHGDIVNILKKVTNRIENSFVSKYLHFHFPHTVPIYDQYAYDQSWRLFPIPKSEWSKWDDVINYDYRFHCASMVGLLDELRANCVASPSLKLIAILLYEGNG